MQRDDVDGRDVVDTVDHHDAREDNGEDYDEDYDDVAHLGKYYRMVGVEVVEPQH